MTSAMRPPSSTTRPVTRPVTNLYDDVARFVASLRQHPGGQSLYPLEDDVQEAMTAILASMDAYLPERGSLKSWAFAVTFHLMLHRKRSRRRYDNHFEPEDALDGWEPLAAQTDPESLVHARQVHDKLVDAFAGLSEDDRTIFQLAIVEGLSHRDIAKKLGISEDVCKKRYSRARQWLAKQINVPADELYSVMPPLLLGEAPPEPSERARQRRLLDLSRHVGFFASILLAATLAAPRWDFVSAQAGLFVPDAHVTLVRDSHSMPTEAPPPIARVSLAKPTPQAFPPQPQLDDSQLDDGQDEPFFSPDGSPTKVGPGQNSLPRVGKRR